MRRQLEKLQQFVSMYVKWSLRCLLMMMLSLAVASGFARVAKAPLAAAARGTGAAVGQRQLHRQQA